MTDQERQLEAGLDAVDVVETQQQEIARKPDRREVIRLAFIVAVVVALIMGGVAIGVSTLAFGEAARTAATQEAVAKDIQKNQELARQAYEAAQAANASLTARGQATVPIPPPNGEDPTATIVAAATARVLASLPPSPPPSADAVATAVANQLMLSPPPGPSPAQVLTAVAAYLRDNPPPPGPAGPTGVPGTDGKDGADGQNGRDGVDGQNAPPPTEAELQQAFVNYIQANPNFLPTQLCAAYGQNFNQAKDLVAQDGSRITLYGCITEVKPPVTSESPVIPTGE